MGTQKGLSILKSIAEFISNSNGYEKCLSKVKFISGGEGSCVAEFKVEPEHLNPMGGLHGGYIATLVDSITSYALMTKPGSELKGGVSVDIHVSYLKGAKEGDDIVVNARTIKRGKTLAFLEVELMNKATNDIIAKANIQGTLAEQFERQHKIGTHLGELIATEQSFHYYFGDSFNEHTKFSSN